MDLHKMKSEEIRGFDAKRSAEVEGQVRRALLDVRMDIYNPAARGSAKIRGLKRTLARILTLRGAAATGAKPAKAAKPTTKAAPKKVSAKAAKKSK
jgi:ribosomal protein L29